eukprot:155172-Amphidinium_carterae.1
MVAAATRAVRLSSFLNISHAVQAVSLCAAVHIVELPRSMQRVRTSVRHVACPRHSWHAVCHA